MDVIMKYLALLTDEERDRVIEAQEWMTGDVANRGARCLRGHAEGLGWHGTKAQALFEAGACQSSAGVGVQFDAMCDRLTLPVAVAQIKAECARLNGVPTAPPARETVGAAMQGDLAVGVGG